MENEVASLKSQYDALDTKTSAIEQQLDNANVTISVLQLQLSSAHRRPTEYRIDNVAHELYPQRIPQVFAVSISFLSAPCSACPSTFCKPGSLT